MAKDKPVTLAAIVGAHGVAGDVRLKLFGQDIAGLRHYRVFNDGALVLERLREDSKGGALARFAGVQNRNEAEALRGTVLTVPRSALPPLAQGEYYHIDLIGLPAISTDGVPLGTVAAVQNFGAGDVLEIAQHADDGAHNQDRPDQDRPNQGRSGKVFMVPMTADAVPQWDESRLLVAAPFAAP